MKKLITILSIFITGLLQAQTSCSGFTLATGTVVGNQTVVLMPVNPPGFCYIQGLVYYPDDYNLPQNSAKKYPLLLTLNGAGEGATNNAQELTNTFVPQLISQGLKPYAIDQVTGDTVKFIVVSPHCAQCNGAYSYPQLQYTIPYLLSSLRVDTNCVWVTGLSQGCRGTVSVVMGNTLGDTALGKKITGIIPISGAGYDDFLTSGTGSNRNLDTILKRGLYVKYAIGDQDQNFNAVGFGLYDSVYRRFCLPGRYDSVIAAGLGHVAAVWNAPWPLAARYFYPRTMSVWSQMWLQRRNAAITQLTVYAGADQTISLPQDSVPLSGIATPVSGTSIASYLWTNVSGPNTPTFSSAASASTIARGLVAGTYKFKLQATSTASTTAVDTVQIIVQAAAVVGPTVTVGSSQTILQPVSSATVTGTAVAGSSAIVSTTWTLVSGSPTPTIVSPGNLTTNITGMTVLGLYVFKLKAVDANGLADSGTVQITVTAAPLTGIHVTKTGPSEYLCSHLYSDSLVRTYIFNGISGKVEFTPYITGGLKQIDVAPLFNRMAVMDVNHYVWTSNSGTPTCTRIDMDTNGVAMNYCDRIYGYYYALFFISADSTKIMYGGTGVNGDTYNFYKKVNNNIGNKPVLFNAPAGKKWVKLALGANMLGLTSAGEVYKWNNGDSNYVKMTTVGKVIDIAASQQDFYTLLSHDYTGGDTTLGNPYWFGSQNGFVGDVQSRTQPFPVRTLWGLTQTCRQIASNNNTVHVIDSSRRMWGIGDNPNGEVGNGQELVNKFTYHGGSIYNWSWTKGEFFTGAPMQQIGAGILWKEINDGNAFSFFHFARDMNDSLYNWGRDKSFIGGKGLVNNNEVSTPNSLDVLSPRLTTPLKNTPAVGFNFQLPSITVTSRTRTINTSTTTLSATGIPAQAGSWGYTVATMLWTKVSGPTCTIVTPLATTATASTQVMGMSAGSYVFTVTMTDNNTGTWQDTCFVTVSGTVFTPPTVTVGGPQTLILPVSSTTITSVCSATGASLVSTVWTKLSGPAAGSITSPNAQSTTVTGLVAGVYVFRMTATDSNGQITTGDIPITVSTLSNFCNCLSSPVPISFPTN